MHTYQVWWWWNKFYLATDPFMITLFKLFLSPRLRASLPVVLVFHSNISGLVPLKSPSGVFCAEFDGFHVIKLLYFHGLFQFGAQPEVTWWQWLYYRGSCLFHHNWPDTTWSMAEHVAATRSHPFSPSLMLPSQLSAVWANVQTIKMDWHEPIKDQAF